MRDRTDPELSSPAKQQTQISDDVQKLWAYLSFGYLPVARQPDPLAALGKPNGSSGQIDTFTRLEPAISTAIRVIKTMAQPIVSRHGTSRHVVLLSGGFDSRAILGSLLEVLHPSEIVTCTYGVPGTEEFEIAGQVARVAGVEHVDIDVRNTSWTTAQLMDSVRARPSPPSFVIGARFHNYGIYRQFGADCVFWDGFLGDALTGSHLRNDSAAADWTVALSDFVRCNSRGRTTLAPSHFDPVTALPSEPLCPPDALGFDDQLDLAIRQSCYIANRLPSDHNVATPFAGGESRQFWLSLPRPFRCNQHVYKEALARAFPKLFAIPVAGGRGVTTRLDWQRNGNSLRRRASLCLTRAFGMPSRFEDPHRSIGNQMRENPSLRNVIGENIADLEQRRLITWLKPGKIWSDHLSGIADNTDPIRILVSLEIGLKAGAERARLNFAFEPRAKLLSEHV